MQRQRSARRTEPDSSWTLPESSAEYEAANTFESEDENDDDNDDDYVSSGHMALHDDANPRSQGKTLLDSCGVPFFDQEVIGHPHSGDWAPLPEVIQ